MKTMKNFAAQQLSKKAMNEVKGGVYCTVYDQNNNKLMEGYAAQSSIKDAIVALNQQYARYGWTSVCGKDKPSF